MPIRYDVAQRTVVLCDYNTGFRPPEMVKRRPVVVVSRRLPQRAGLCTVVPLSTTPPPADLPYVREVRLTLPLPPPFDAPRMWAKADMVATVAFERLDLVRTARDQYGKRKYLHPLIVDADWPLLVAALLHGVGLGDLTKPPPTAT